jgi:ElaB/YqjD/DUF883 family membrane-anchored ribosome-binding protein
MQPQVNDSAKTSDGINRIADAVAPAVQDAADGAVRATYALADAADQGLDTLSDRREAAVEACRDAIVARPLSAIGVAALAGLVIGALLRR